MTMTRDVNVDTGTVALFAKQYGLTEACAKAVIIALEKALLERLRPFIGTLINDESIGRVYEAASSFYRDEAEGIIKSVFADGRRAGDEAIEGLDHALRKLEDVPDSDIDDEFERRVRRAYNRLGKFKKGLKWEDI